MEEKSLSCPICKSLKIRPFIRKNGYNLFSCRSCKLIFMYPLNIIRDIDKTIYNKQYFYKDKAEKSFGYANYEEDKKPMVRTFSRYLDLLEKFMPGRGKLLDIGAATGFFLSLAKNRGWEATGVEISEYAAVVGRENGLNIVLGTMRDFAGQPENFDAITYFDVFEHIFDPVEELAAIHLALKPKGILVINTPDAGSLIAKMTGKRWYSLLPPEHAILYRPDNLKRMLSDNGFEVLLVKKIGKQFTIQYIFQIMANWIKIDFFLKIANLLNNKYLNRLIIPLNVRDNFLLIARKK